MPAQILSNGETIYFQEEHVQCKGVRPSILFIHGNFSSHAWYLDTIASLPPKNHIINVDLRGFGESTYIKRCKYFADWAADLVDLCGKLEVGEVIAVGMSFGGGVAMKLALIAPKLVSRILLTSSVSHSGLMLTTDKQACRTQEEISGNQKAKFMLNLLAENNKQAMRQVYDAILFPKMANYPQNKKQLLVDTAFQQRCYIDLLHALANSDINLPDMTANIVMIHGDEDQVVTLESVKLTAAAVKNFQIWNGHAHMLPFQDLERYVAVLIDLIQ